jgi:hypothetical protein
MNSVIQTIASILAAASMLIPTTTIAEWFNWSSVYPIGGGYVQSETGSANTTVYDGNVLETYKHRANPFSGPDYHYTTRYNWMYVEPGATTRSWWFIYPAPSSSGLHTVRGDHWAFYYTIGIDTAVTFDDYYNP